MQNVRKFLLTVALMVGAVCLTSAPALAGVASMSVGGAGIQWSPSVAYESAVLTVSGGDGVMLRYEFDAGVAPSLDLFDKDGYPLPDGSYTWELRLAPQMDAATLRQLEAARESGAALRVEPITDSGYFTVRGGAFVNPNAEEMGLAHQAGQGPLAGGEPSLNTRDQLINDDLIVLQSLCVGVDCTNGENFGFDTIRLKENNLRIKFQDTSVGTFPSTDWQLTANDSASGGANRFSIDDVTAGRTPFTIEGSAPTHSLYVDDGGRIGVGTSTPVVEVHIKDGDTPTLRLEQDGSAGFAAQTWDVAGNETNWFVRDASNGSKIPFKIRPNAPTNSLYINTDGNIGVATGSPDSDADVTVQAAEDVAIRMKKAGAVRFELNNTSNSTQWRVTNDGNGDFAVSLVGGGGNMFEIEQDGDIGNCGNPMADLVISDNASCNSGTMSSLNAGDTMFTVTSSRTLKENLVPVAPEGILEQLQAISVYNYDFIEGPKGRLGLMAEDFHSVFNRGSDRVLNGTEVQMALWLAVQELTARNETLKATNSELEQRLEALEAAVLGDAH